MNRKISVLEATVLSADGKWIVYKIISDNFEYIEVKTKYPVLPCDIIEVNKDNEVVYYYKYCDHLKSFE